MLYIGGSELSLYVMADLHLSLSEKTNKSMEVFGPSWANYTERINKNWRAVINDDDIVVVPGDISWAMRIDEAYEDLKFINELPGTKIISKGNHDFWWSTVGRVDKYLSEKEFATIKLLHNNAFLLDDCVVCGTRGWFYDEKQQNTANETDFEKIIAREVGRLKTSIESAISLQSEDRKIPILVFLHFPPVWGGVVCEPILQVLKDYGIKHCYFGHIHGIYNVQRTFEYDGIRFTLVAADFLKFAPMPIFPDED